MTFGGVEMRSFSTLGGLRYYVESYSLIRPRSTDMLHLWEQA